jgi:hypothetical protein
VPQVVHVTFDGMDDRYLAAFDNYPDAEKLVLVGWGTTGDVAGEPITVLVATAGHIITGYVDDYFDIETEQDPGEPDADPIEHHEPPPKKRLAALLARLRKVSKTTWLLVHDADDIDTWIEQGFRQLEPPPDVPPDKAAMILAWGDLPEDAHALLHARGLSWRHAHRSGED